MKYEQIEEINRCKKFKMIYIVCVCRSKQQIEEWE